MPINKFTTLLDLARQAKIISGETATFDGKIQVGIPFSGYPTGVDTGTTVSLGVVSSETAVFSGNTGTTIFDVSNPSSPNYSTLFSGFSGTVWTNPLFSGNTSGLTLPITILSAETQTVGPFWTLTQTGMTGDYVIDTQYTGYSITYSFFTISGLNTGFTEFSGFTSASQENFSAGTLDYKGPLDYISSKEDGTIEGRLTTNKLTVTGGASVSTIGYVLTQTGDTGEAGWVFNSASASTNTFVTGGTLNGTQLDLSYNTGGSVPSIELSGLTFTGNTSGGCITDLYVTNLYGCSPLHIEPSGVNDVYIVENGGNVGVGTPTPTEKLHIDNGDILVTDTNGSFSTDIQNSAGPLTLLSGATTELPRFGVKVPTYDSVTFGIRGGSEPTFTGYGKQGDAFIYSSAQNNGFNIVSEPGTGTDDYIRFFAGRAGGAANTPDLHIQGSGTTGSVLRGNVGINTDSPTEKLHVNGNTKISGSLNIGNVLGNTPIGNLGFDSSGNVVTGTTGGGTFTGNTSGDCITDLFVTNLYGCSPLHIDPSGLNNVYIVENGGNVGIGTTATTVTLDVAGETRLSGSGQNILTVIGSGDTQPLFTVQGSSGELFTITDSLVGSLFAVNDISGLPILEVFDDDTVHMGSYQAPSLNTTVLLNPSTGLSTVYSIPMSAYTGAWFEYTVSNIGGARAGQIMSIFSGNTVNFTETTTTDIGSTSDVTFTMSADSTNTLLQVSATTTGWEVKTIVRSI